MLHFTRISTEFLVNTRTRGSQINPAVAALAGGAFVTTWTDDGCPPGDAGGPDVRAKLYDAAGPPIRGEFLVNTETIDYQCDPKVVGLRDGGFVVVWQDFSGRCGDASGTSIKAKTFRPNGNLLRDEFLVNVETADDQTNPAVAALADGGFVVAWQDFSGTRGDANAGSIKARLFGLDGAPAGDEFLVNTYTEGHQGSPAIAGLAEGGFVVTWNDFSGTLGDVSAGSIKAKVFGPGGEIVQDEFLVNTRTWDNQSLPTVAGLEDGGFVIAWTDCSGTLGDRSGTSIKARLFDPAGEPEGDEFLVNTETLNSQLSPALAPLADSGFVVVWTDYSGRGGDASGSGIKAKVFGPTGRTVQDEFLVNTGTEGNQSAPAVAGLADGGFVIIWEDASGTGEDTSSTGIKAQMFSPSTMDPSRMHSGVEALRAA